ncbi:MAG: ribosome maturation factor RimP [Burkholderiales bacterium]|nr:ribosome maturation factor RimP [Burkholderiales bacterium]
MRNLDELVEATVAGLGYELVDFERPNRGRLLRIFIDRPAGSAAAGITVEDCERASRQVSRVLEVEGFDYDRLEVSSPGLDRVLKKPADFRRFVGEPASLSLRAPVGGRKRFTGVLRGASEEGVDLEVDGTMHTFRFADVERARLVPRI